MRTFKIILAITLTLLIIYFAGPSPSAPKYAIDLPMVIPSAATLEEYVFMNEGRDDIKPGNEAEIIWADSSKKKTEYVLLYLHGYSASKFEGEPAHRNFAEKYGMNAYLARLSDHGIDTSDAMFRYTADRVWNSAVKSLMIARKLGDKVIIMSTSTGGTLALKLASKFEDIAGLINYSPNIHPVDPSAFLLNNPWGKEICEWVLDGDFRYIENKDSVYEKYWYTKYRIESLVEMQNLVETSMHEETFKKIRIPVLNMCYYLDEDHQDQVVSTLKIREMHRQLGTPEDKKRLVLTQSGVHVIACELYSEDFDFIMNQTFLFAEEVLKLETVNHPSF